MSVLLRVSVIVGLAAVLACVPACGKKDSAGKAKIGVVTNCTADFWTICEAGAKKAAEENNVELQFRQPEKNFDAKVQMEIVEAWAKQGLDGIAVSVIDPDGQTEDLTRIAKKVPLIAMDNDADKTGRMCYIGIDNYEAGKAVGRLVKKALPDGGTIGVFIGSTKSANGKARVQGVLDELAGAKDAHRHAGQAPAEARPRRARPTASTTSSTAPRRRTAGRTNAADRPPARCWPASRACRTCAWSGCTRTTRPRSSTTPKPSRWSKEIKIIGFDEDRETLKGIAAGEIEATVVQDPFKYGYKSVKCCAATEEKSKLSA